MMNSVHGTLLYLTLNIQFRGQHNRLKIGLKAINLFHVCFFFQIDCANLFHIDVVGIGYEAHFTP